MTPKEKVIKELNNKCDSCGDQNVPWHTPDNIWLRFCEKLEHLCPKCFVKKAKHKLKPNEGIGFLAEIFYK